MAPPKLLALARQGDLEAMTRLINRSLQAQNVTAKLMRHEGCLKVLLEGEQAPPQSLAKSLQAGLEKLGIQDIDRLEIHGKQRDANALTWTKTVQLAPQTEPGAEVLPEASSAGHASTSPAPADIALTQISPAQTFPFRQFSPNPNSATEPIAAKSRPRARPPSYMGLALLTTVLAFPPLGIAALLFARRVKPQYRQQNDEGARSASETAKILCIVGICLASPFYLAIGFLAAGYSIFTVSYEQQIDILYESQAKTTIEAINRSQQAYWLENRKFADSASQLQMSLQPMSRYRYQFIATEPDRSIVTAMAIKPGLKSFVGIVYAIPAQPVVQSSEFVKTTSIQSAICTTDFPIPIGQIRLEGNQIICPP